MYDVRCCFLPYYSLQVEVLFICLEKNKQTCEKSLSLISSRAAAHESEAQHKQEVRITNEKKGRKTAAF